MRKVLFTVALFFTACAVSAQESVVKEAKSAKGNPEEAAKIINYLLNDETAVSIFGAEHGALGSAKMNEFIKPQLSEANQIVIDFTQYASQFSTPRNNVPAGGSEINSLLNRAAESVGFGTDIETAVNEFFDLAENALN